MKIVYEVCGNTIRLNNKPVGCIKSKGIIPDQMDDIEDCNDFEVQEES